MSRHRQNRQRYLLPTELDGFCPRLHEDIDLFSLDLPAGVLHHVDAVVLARLANPNSGPDRDHFGVGCNSLPRNRLAAGRRQTV
jgi:hypothetical protein